MNLGVQAKGAVLWLGRWAVAATAVTAAWVGVTLAQGGRLDEEGAGCGSPDASPIFTVVMSAAIALPLAAAWSAVRAWARMDEPHKAAAQRTIIILALLAALVVLYSFGILHICFGARVLSTLGTPLPPSP